VTGFSCFFLNDSQYILRFTVEMKIHNQEPEQAFPLVLFLLSASQPIYTTFGQTCET
jgi:hypothetical protein